MIVDPETGALTLVSTPEADEVTTIQVAGEIIKALTPFRTDVDFMRGLFLALRHELALDLDLAPAHERRMRKDEYIGELGLLIGFTNSHPDV